MILKQRSRTMFQDRIRKLENKLHFPKYEDFGTPHTTPSFFVSTSQTHQHHWIPSLITLSFLPPHYPTDTDVLHLYYYCFTYYAKLADGSHQRRRYEYEEVY
jgi:hypothetical protein